MNVIHFYTNKKTFKLTLTFATLEKNKKSISKQYVTRLRSLTMTNYNENIERAILQMKINFIEKKGILFIIQHTNENFLAYHFIENDFTNYYTFNKLVKICIDDALILTKKFQTDINDVILDKMICLLNISKKPNAADDFSGDSIRKIINDYLDTGIVLVDQLNWMNSEYLNFKGMQK